ncbi:MAG: hypothetical protein PUB42_01995 [Firmicutes bacterium]|nr:hypothetical protein [Bacillota bacterium]
MYRYSNAQSSLSDFQQPMLMNELDGRQPLGEESTAHCLEIYQKKYLCPYATCNVAQFI